MQEICKSTIIILAGGQGKRMQSFLPKVLHEISLQPIIQYVLNLGLALNSNTTDLNVVINEELNNNPIFKKIHSKFRFKKILQKDSLGTGDALRTAFYKINSTNDFTLILYGDTPFIKKQTVLKMYNQIKNGSDISIIGFHSLNPKGYGRIIAQNHNNVLEIIEEKNANTKQKTIQLCNSGIILVKRKILSEFLAMSTACSYNLDNEFYLTDIVKFSVKNKKRSTYVIAKESEVTGINDKRQLVHAEKYNQINIVNKLLDKGVIVMNHETSYFANNISIQKDVIIYPNVFIGHNTAIMRNSIVHSFSYLEEVSIGKNSIIGPFARIRPNTKIGDNSKVGNFVEVKNSILMNNVKAGHLSYIGDVTIKNNVNIGAGTVFCNYDGKKKQHSYVGHNAFIGSNASIISPVKISARAMIAAGSVITKNVEEKDLALARAKQINLKNKSKIS